MAGTVSGGKAAAATNKLRYGDNFYAIIGQKGGREGTDGGFGSKKIGVDGLTGRERARLHGAAGGRKSRKPKHSYEGTRDHADVTDERG